MPDRATDLRPDSVAIHADRPLNETSAVTPPIWQSSTFAAGSAEEFLEMATEPRHDKFYTRQGNPTHSQAAAVIAGLEGAETAVMAGSGMGAISTAVLAFVGAGDHVVAQRDHYSGTATLLRTFLARMGVEVTFVDQTDAESFARAVRPGRTKVVTAETPTNPLMHVTDLGRVAEIARDCGAVTLVDNTFATPVNQRPVEFGIDLVVHSCTKYMGGHSDLIAGAVAGRAELVEKVWSTANVLGATLSPFDAWLLLRGLRTLALRVARHNQTALAAARLLEAHPAVARVHYAGLPSHPQHELARTQMSGFGGVVTFELAGGYAAAEQFLSSVQLFTRAPSLGGVESLAAHPAAMWAKSMDEARLKEAGIAPGLVRLSIGLEDERDVNADLERSLDLAARAV